MKKDKVGFKGYFVFRHERNGKLLEEFRVDNTVTTNGKERSSGLLNGQRTGVFDCIRIGTSETAAAASQTDLKAAITAGSLAGASATTSQHTTDETNDTTALTHTFNSTGSYTIKEAGIFTTTSGGCMLARGTFTGKALANGDSLTVYYKIDLD